MKFPDLNEHTLYIDCEIVVRTGGSGYSAYMLGREGDTGSIKMDFA